MRGSHQCQIDCVYALYGIKISWFFEARRTENEGGMQVTMEAIYISSRQNGILSILKRYPQGLPVRAILEFLHGKTSLSTLKRDLLHLKKTKFVFARGKGRSTLWYLTTYA